MNVNKNVDNVLFYSEKLMKDGKMHYAVGVYNRITGIATYPSDLIDFIKDNKNNDNN